MPHDQPPVLKLDPDFLYELCLDQVQALVRMRPALSSLKTPEILWSLAVSYAHALETAFRIVGAMGASEPDRLVRLVATLVKTPTPTGLYNLWYTWRRQHLDWADTDIMQVPVYLLLCQTNCSDLLRELGRRGRALNPPVFKTWAGLSAGPVRPDKDRTLRFLGAMDATLRSTVHRHLDLTPSDDDDDKELSPITDPMAVAMEGAVGRKHRAEEWIGELFRSGGTIQTDSSQSIEVPTIPELPIRGMEGTDARSSVWRAASHDAAFRLLAKIAPGTLGLLETALPDAAHAAQRADREKADAKKRGGSGGQKAKKAGTAEPPVQHVPVGNPEVEENSPFIEPKDDYPNPEQMIEAHEEVAKAKKDARFALRIAIDRWGASGQRMLEALAEGKTDKAAAEAAGISAPALIKRKKTLKKLLGPRA
jgi:hypothetical protein